jgi:hypothetical protein
MAPQTSNTASIVVSSGGSRGAAGLGGSAARKLTGGGGAERFCSGGSAITNSAPSTNPSMIHDGVLDSFDVEIG